MTEIIPCDPAEIYSSDLSIPIRTRNISEIRADHAIFLRQFSHNLLEWLLKMRTVWCPFTFVLSILNVNNPIEFLIKFQEQKSTWWMAIDLYFMTLLGGDGISNLIENVGYLYSFIIHAEKMFV